MANNGRAYIPYEENHRLKQLGLVITVVNRGQSDAIVSLLNQSECALSLTTHGRGSAPNDVYAAFGIVSPSKHVVFGVLREEKWPEFKEALEKRFSVSNAAKGISYFVSIDALLGVSVYKMLANLQTLDSTMKKGKKAKKEGDMMEEKKEATAPEEKKEVKEVVEAPEKGKRYQAILAIVNNGYSDLVMNAARDAGARGGTIITAKGTGNKDIEKFYGIVITPEKEIVMILVPEAIRDKVLAAINLQAGIASKGQGIAFSLPVDDVVGVRSEEAEPSESNA